MEDLVLQPWQQICAAILFCVGFMVIMSLRGSLSSRKVERDASWVHGSRSALLLLDLKGLVLQLVDLKLGNRAEQKHLRDLVTRIEELTGKPLRHQKEARRKWEKSSGIHRGSATAAEKKGKPRRKPKRRKGSRTGSA